MSHFTIEKGRRYQATISLGLLRSVASNEMVADKLRELGFSDVAVTGSGRTRIATGVWTQENMSGAIPEEITDVKMLA